jgi:hypothetical protein
MVCILGQISQIILKTDVGVEMMSIYENYTARYNVIRGNNVWKSCTRPLPTLPIPALSEVCYAPMAKTVMYNCT